MKRNISLVLLVIILITSTGSLAMDLEGELKAYLVGDYESGRILEGFRIDEPVYIASISKTMSYSVIMDSQPDLEEKILIDEDILSIGGSMMKLEAGAYYTVDQLLDYGLIVSSNNAIYALAKHVAGSEEKFVELMNKKAQEIGLESAKFYNSTGLPVEGIEDQNRMTSRDIFKMASYIIRNYDILERTRKKEILGLDFFGEERLLKSTNPTLVLDGVDGFKTGRTAASGYSLVSTMDRGDFRLLAIFMGARSDARRAEISREAMEDLAKRYTRQRVLDREEALDSLDIEGSKSRNLKVYPREDLDLVIDRELGLSYELVLREDLKLPAKKGTGLGQVIIYNGDQEVARQEFVARQRLARAGIFTGLRFRLEDWFRKIFRKD